MALEYGLLASMSSIVSSILTQLGDAWDSTPWWAITAGVVVLLGIGLFWRTR